MLILPIVNKNRVMNVHIKIKSAEKIRQKVSFNDAKESEIIVNREKFSDSIFSESKDISAPIEFVRSKSLLYPRNFLITTKTESSSSLYDVYEVSQPPRKVNDSLDKLYSCALTDMRKEIPGSKKGRYVSLEKLGINEHLTDEKIAKLQRIVKDNIPEKWPHLFQEEGIADLKETIDFINNFECTVVSDTTIPENSLQDVLKSLDVINTRDSRNLKNYYSMAQTNRDIYSKISYINKIIYDKPLALIKSQKQKQKQLIKVKEESEYKNVA